MEAVSLDLTRALAIDGWMTPEELVWLAQQATVHSVIVEIGSYRGRSTRALGDHTSGVVFALDDWRGPDEAHLTYAERQTIEAEFTQNLADLLAKKTVIPMTIDHQGLGLLRFERQPDMIFIDGDHAYDSVVRDVNWAVRTVQPGGLVCGHDRDRQTVEEALKKTLRTWTNGPDSLWWVTWGPRSGAPKRGSWVPIL